MDLYSSTSTDIDTNAGGSITFTGGCETSTTTISAGSTTDLTLTSSGGAAFTDGVYNCTLVVNDGSATSNTLTRIHSRLTVPPRRFLLPIHHGYVTTTISFPDNTNAGTTIATVSGTDTYASTLTYTESATGDAVANAALRLVLLSGLGE